MAEYIAKTATESTTAQVSINNPIVNALTSPATLPENTIINISEKKHIFWNIVNCLIASSLVVLGGLTVGRYTWETFFTALLIGGVAFFTQFKSFWAGEQQVFAFF